ncbi:MAG TPA: hypothetical protein VKG45_01705 [Actinomycetes bacterium]|nr:hypothetical protein [Actinomycetes bacterium]
MPYPLALGLWTGLVSQFVPTVGIYIAGALPVLIALPAAASVQASSPPTGAATRSCRAR